MSGKTCRIAVLGAGSWGTALASVLARKGHETVLWGRDEETIAAINAKRRNPRYLPDIALPDELAATGDVGKALQGAELILLVTPAQTIAKMAEALSGKIGPATPLILCAKGIDRKTGKLPAETLARRLAGKSLAALSGPSFAHDVARGLPTAVTLAHPDGTQAARLAAVVSSGTFRVYASTDLKGVELGGALKNVIALGVGVCRGMGLGASAEAALIARGFAELSRLATRLGANPQTLMGLSGLGDLVLTCSGTQSRNFAYGMAIGEGKDTSGLPLAEGAFTAGIAASIAGESGIEAPLISTVAKLVDGTITPRVALQELLARPLRNESEE
ncbi:MAG: NAD(P)-dependent glycerol-3-phosphate dehydrogenase [Phyllobacteriaceae bacterium]|nr:NAD(P)-dependent glycerol-3-phosphate dehydrogenase [Phyllobacteriaceae bacterium]